MKEGDPDDSLNTPQFFETALGIWKVCQQKYRSRIFSTNKFIHHE
jgi:hypothetical protein